MERSSLITEVGTEDGASAYEASEFELTVEINDVEVSITPDLIEVAAYADDYPVIERVLSEEGLMTFALAHDLVVAHSDGDLTTRQIAQLTALSYGTVHDLIGALAEIHDLGGADSPCRTC